MSRIEKALEKAIKQRKTGGASEQAAQRGSEAARPVEHAEGAQHPIDAENPYLVTLTHPESHASEEYRKLKSLVVKLAKMEKFHNTLMVTSTVGGEGKSITALNLAITLAQEYDHTVLLVDADLRHPCLHRYLGLEPSIGLADCLTNGVDVGDALLKTDVGTLVVLPAGKQVSNPVELLSSSRMKRLVEELKHRYTDRFVIFDTPPVLPFAEAHTIGSIVDGVLFVVRHGQVSLHSLKEALNMMKDAKVHGLVYNDMSIEDSGDRYYHYRYYRAKQKLAGGKKQTGEKK